MNGRIAQVIQDLARMDSAPSLESLSERYHVSSRTVRTYIKTINKFLNEKSIDGLCLGHGGLIEIPQDFSKALQFLPSHGFYSYKLTSEEREKLAAVILVSARDYVTLASIAERFSVSRTTIINDLDGIKQTIREAGLEVTSRPNHGLIVSGSEWDIRGFLLDFYCKKEPIVDQWLSMPENAVMREDSIIVGKILNEQAHTHHVLMDDHAFLVARSYLAIAVQRARGASSRYLTGAEQKGGEIRTDVGSFAEEVIHLISQYCTVELTANEVYWFAEVLNSCQCRCDQSFRAEDVQVQKVTRDFIVRVSEMLDVNLADDYDLFEFLSNHLESMFSSPPSHFPENPALREIVADQPMVLKAVRRNLPMLEAYNGSPVTETEVTYVALHICAALERRKNQEGRIRIVVVCDGGVGTSQLLAENLRSQFDVKIVKVIPAHELPYLDMAHTELVISTVPIENCQIANINVTFPLTESGLERIRKKIEEVRSTKGRVIDASDDELTAQGLLDRIEPVIKAEVDVDSYPDLLRGIRKEVRRYFHEAQHLEEEILVPYLHQLLPASHIQLDVACSDWRDAILQSSAPLVRMGYIEERYIAAMIASVEKNGPYIVLAPGFAVPHEAPEQGAIKMGMNLIRLKDPIPFGVEEYDPVEFVCTLSAIDRKSHLKAFFNLVNMLTKPDFPFKQALCDAKTPQEAAMVVEHFEYRIVE
jgi:mannitol operon transcriptional antiterminator